MFVDMKPRMTAATLSVLEVLLGSDDELYGLKIARAVGRPTGSIYPILARLEQIGWVKSEWEAGDPASRGPRRRFYWLSAEGLAGARAALDGRRQSASAPIPQPGMTGPVLGFLSPPGG